MVGFPKPVGVNLRDSGWNPILEKLDVCNLLSLDPYEPMPFSIWAKQFRNCSNFFLFFFLSFSGDL